MPMIALALGLVLPAAEAADQAPITEVTNCQVPTVDPGSTGNFELDDIDWCGSCAPFPFSRSPQASGPPFVTSDLFGDLIMPAQCGPHGCPIDLEIHGGGWVNYDGPSEALSTLAQPLVLPSSSISVTDGTPLQHLSILRIGLPIAGEETVVAVGSELGGTLAGVEGGDGAFPAGTWVTVDCSDPSQFGRDQCELRREARIRASAFGVATFIVEYPLQQTTASENSIPAQVSAVLCAVRALTFYGNEGYGVIDVDTSRLLVTGYSAGGQLAALLGPVIEKSAHAGVSGYDSDLCLYNDTVIGNASGVVGFYGFYHLEYEPPASITSRALNVIYPAMRGVAVAGNPANGIWIANQPRVQKYSPYDQYDGKSPPILLLHGAADQISADFESRDMLAKATRYKVPALLIEAPGLGHGWFAFEHQDARTEAAACTLMQFYQDRLQPNE